jgi:hypothetical protein
VWARQYLDHSFSYHQLYWFCQKRNQHSYLCCSSDFYQVKYCLQKVLKNKGKLLKFNLGCTVVKSQIFSALL